MTTRDKLNSMILTLMLGALVVVSGSIIGLMPVVSALEDQESSVLSETLAGRVSLSCGNIPAIVAIATFLAGVSYLICKYSGIKPFANRDFKIAALVWGSLVVCGLGGAVTFCLQIPPFKFASIHPSKHALPHAPFPL